MFYKIINTQILECLIIFSFLSTFSSCVTTRVYESPDSFQYETLADVTKIILKNGIMINCKNKSVDYEFGSDRVRFISIVSADSVREGDKGYSYRTDWNKLQIPEKDILKVQMEKMVIGTLGNVLIILAALTAAAIAIGSSLKFF